MLPLIAPSAVSWSWRSLRMTCQLLIRPRAIVAALLSVLLATTAAQAGEIISTFDTDSDGWTVFQNTSPDFDWIPAGGNPNGHIGATDNTSDWAYVQAPSKFLGPAQYGGTFSFDLRHDNLQQPSGFPSIFNVRVGLQGAGLTLINEGALPTTDWENYIFTLDESSLAGWRKFSNLSQNYSAGAPSVTSAEMQSVLDTLTRVVIATDYTLASTDSNVPEIDRTYIDNVRLTTVDEAVPEPSTFVLAALGLLGLGFVALRKKYRRA